MVIGLTTQNTPSGYLRCNGANVSKITYSNLYSTIGDTYTKVETLGYGSPHYNQSQFNENNDLILSNWTNNNILSYATTYYSIEVIKNKIYIIGGFSGSTYYGTLQKITLNTDGSIASVTTHSTTLPQNIAYHSFIVIQNYIYIIGGRLSSGASVNTVYRATIDSNGEIGTFSLYTTLPSKVDSAAIVRIKNYLYLIGGRSSSNASNSIYRFTIDINGNINFASYVLSTAPNSWYGITAIIHKNRLLLAGGNSIAGGGTPQSVINVYAINPDGTITLLGNATSLPAQMAYIPFISTKERFYLLRSGSSNVIYSGTFNVNSNSISWVTGSTTNGGILPGNAIYGSYICAVNKYVYLFGLAGTTSIVRCNFNGGYNDYSLLTEKYDSTKFALPDFTLREQQDKVYYYIKT